MNEKRGALAGPESAAEHVRNALQLLVALDEETCRGDTVAARARLVAALAILEAKP